MKFTREDIEEIKHKLEMLYPPKNDWQLSKCVLPIHGEEEIVIMQRGRNVRCNINDIYRHILSKEFGAFINMDYCNKFPVMSVQEVIAYVDPAYRRKGMVVTFQTPEYYHDVNDNTKGHPVWEIWQFTGEVSQWNDLSKWGKLFSNDINNIKITGAKIEGGSLFIQVGSAWVKTDINIVSAGGIEKTLDDYKKETDNTIKTLSDKIKELEEKINNQPVTPPVSDVIVIDGSFSYSGTVPSSGGTASISSNTLKLKKNGVALSGIVFTYELVGNPLYAAINQTNGNVSFQNNTGNNRTVYVVAKCAYDGKTYTTSNVSVTQDKYVAPVEDVYALSGSFSYSGNIAASGGTKAPTNTLGITKNGVAVSGVTITYSSNQSYATVDSTGKVTFSSHTNTSARTATITATVTDGTHQFTKTANVTQSAYVAPTETLTYYADIKTLSAGGSAGISDITAPTSFTNGTFNYTVPAKGNTVILLCPSSKSLQSCIKQGEILDNITVELNSSVTNVTYNSKSYKMYQFRYAANIQGEIFEVKFN